MPRKTLKQRILNTALVIGAGIAGLAGLVGVTSCSSIPSKKDAMEV